MRKNRNAKFGSGRKMNIGQAALTALFLMSVLAADLCAADKLPQVKLSVKPLDLSRPVSRDEIMAAGQLGGQLYPTHVLAGEAQEQEIHNSFAEAI